MLGNHSLTVKATDPPVTPAPHLPLSPSPIEGPARSAERSRATTPPLVDGVAVTVGTQTLPDGSTVAISHDPL